MMFSVLLKWTKRKQKAKPIDWKLMACVSLLIDETDVFQRKFERNMG